MPITVLIKKTLQKPIDNAVLLISKKLIPVLGENLLLVESFDGADGSNVRIVVKEKTDSVIDAVLRVVGDVEDELGVVGLIFPDIVTPDEFKMQNIYAQKPDKNALEKLKKKLSSILCENLLLVESFDGADGSNVRIVVKEKTDSVIDAVLRVVGDVEDELGVVGLIFPDIVTPDEI